MFNRHILAAAISIAAVAMGMSAANAMKGRAAIDRCIDLGSDGGCIFSCNQTTGACKIDMLDTGQTIICPSPTDECHMGRRQPKAGLSGAGAKTKAPAIAQ